MNRGINLLIGFFVVLTTLSCSSEKDFTDDSEPLFILSDNSDILAEECTELYDSNYTGVICCIERNSPLELNEIVEYQYHTNIQDPVVSWTVSEDIEIVSGQNSHILRIILREGFTEGYISGGTPKLEAITCRTSVDIVRNY